MKRLALIFELHYVRPFSLGLFHDACNMLFQFREVPNNSNCRSIICLS